LKPFFGSKEDAMRMARVDNDQFIIIKIIGFVGNPWKRSSLGFLVEFEDGETPLLPFTPDLMLTGPMEAYISSTPSLWPLRFKTGAEALRERTIFNKQIISGILVGVEILVNIRVFNGTDSSWYDSHKLPLDSIHVVVGQVVTLANKDKSVRVTIPVYADEFIFDALDVHMYLYTTLPSHAVIMDNTWVSKYPNIFKL
jgi:hypothetical protein